ncbi:MAG: AI-2E family transporter [Acidobacteriaceae bacterium]|nr:AI-2E family transporter [Acidobacteriaceae bacterium]MBV9442570.1 AI-2E family transporter [Acidobacteriaceae bacterium]
MAGIDARALRVAWTVFLFALLLAVLYYIRDILVLFAVSIFVAYILSPLVDGIERFGPTKRRGLALAIVYVLVIGLLVLFGFELIPTLAAQAMSLLTHLPQLVSGEKLNNIPLPHFLEPLRAQVITAMTREAKNLESSVVPFLQRAGAQILSGLSVILPVILVPILAFFFLKDARSIRDSVLCLLSGEYRRTAEGIIDGIHVVLRNYIRALVLLAAASFCAWAIFLSAMRYPYELLLAGLAALLEFIPVIGPAVALVIMSIVVLVTGTGGLLWIVVFWGCFRVFQDYVLSPYLMSSGIELHPLLVLFGVLAGEALAGIPGLFFSVPVLAILRVIYNHLRDASMRRELAPHTIEP